MIAVETFRKMALSFSGATEHLHFDRPSFKVKKIFATIDLTNNRVCLMLSQKDQSVFCAFDKTILYPVPNKWGKQGATYVELKTIRKDMLHDALTQAYNKCVAIKPTRSNRQK